MIKAALATAILLSPWVMAGAALGAAASIPEFSRSTQIAQLPRYSASGIHRCGNDGGDKHSCVVTGLFSDCNEAAMSLRTRDCCPTSKGGGSSTGFAVTYCIPDVSGR